MTQFILIFLILISTLNGDSLARRRLRRQILPSQHIQVHSIDSKVLLDKLINVDSTDSRVELSEKNLNGTIWAQRSKVQFDTYDTFVNATAETAQSIMSILNCVFIHGTALESQLFMRTNRTSDGHTYLNHQLYDNANVSLTDEGVQVQGIGARRIGIEAQTWEKYLEKSMTLSALNNPVSGDRELMLTIDAPLYHVDVCFVGAMIYIEFGDKLVQIDPDFRNVVIYSNRYTINFKTKDLATPYDVKLSNEEITIRCPQEQTTVFVQPGGVNVHVEEFSRMQLDRGGGEMLIGGQPLNADTVRVISLAALLSISNNGNVRADTTKSEILVQTPVQNVGLTAAHHDIQVLGGVPHLIVEAGLAIVEVTASNGFPSSVTLLPPFIPPEDRYLTIGPYQAPNVTSSPMIFPEPARLNVTQSPLDGCGGGFGVHPRNQTIYPSEQEMSTSPTTPVTHEVVTYQTPSPFPTLIPTTEGTYPFPTDVDFDISSTTEVPIIPGSVGPIEVTPETTVVTTTPPDETYTSMEDLLNTTPELPEVTTPEVLPDSTTISQEFTTLEQMSTPEPSELPVDQETSTISVPQPSELPIDQESTPTIPEPSEFPMDQETSTVSVPQPSELPIDQGSTPTIPEPSELPVDQETSTPSVPQPSELPIDQEPTPTIPEPSQLPTDIPQPSELPVEQTSTESIPEPSAFPVDQQEITPSIPEPSALPMESTTIDMIPFPSELPTDDFVIGHWFSTEDSSERSTTEIPEFSITATIGNIDLATVQTATATPTEPIPTPPPSLGNGKLLVLKMRVPDGIDVNSPDFAQNITMSLKRLVRDTRTKVERRIKRNTENVTDDDPLKVKQIMKFDNITVVTFAFESLEVTQADLEKALYDLEIQDLNQYFDFPTMEHISAIESTYKNLAYEDENEIPYFLIIVLAIIISVIVLGSLYFFSHGETTMILKRMGRHFSKYTAPAHSPPQEAFQTA